MRAVLTLLCCITLSAAPLGCGGKRSYEGPKGETVTQRGSSVTVESEQGRTEIEGEEGSVTITTEEGTVKYESGKGISEENLGLPFYPGAEQEVAHSWVQQGEEEQGSLSQVTLTTADPVEKVKAFYLKKFPDADTFSIETGGVQQINIKIEKGKEHKLVVISRDKEEDLTRIILHRNVESETSAKLSW